MAEEKEGQETVRQETRQGAGGEQASAQPSPQTTRTTQATGGQEGGEGRQAGLSRRRQFSPMLFASPFTLMHMLNEEMARLFTDVGSGRGSLASRGAGSAADWSPRVEAFERDGQLVVRADLPGLNKDDVQVEVEDDALVISGDRRQKHEEHRDGYSVCELSHGSFYRRIPLPEGAGTGNATATFRNGVLEVAMPAAQREERRRTLEVQDAGRPGEQPQAQAAGSKS